MELKKYLFYTFVTITILFTLAPFIFLETYELGFSMEKVLDNIIIFGVLSFALSIAFHKYLFRPTELKNKVSKNIIKGLEMVFGTLLT